MQKSEGGTGNESVNSEIGSKSQEQSLEDGAVKEKLQPINGTNVRQLVASKIESSSNIVPECSESKNCADTETPGEDEAMIKKTSTRSGLLGFSEQENNMEFATSLTENTYSLIYIANPRRWAFYIGIAFFLFQSALPMLALVGLLDLNSKNTLKAPVDVDRFVRAAGYLTLMLSVPLFRDLLDSIERFHEGYHPIVLKHSPHATKLKWSLSIALQFTSGLLFQFIIFVLVVQSDSVIGMLLNFAALQFITEIDDVAFALASRGYFSSSLKQSCRDVQDYKPPNSKGPWLRRAAFVFFVALVSTCYSVIFVRQRRGDFSCSRIEVQFGDAYWSELPFYSGVYYVERAKRENRRLVYQDETTNGQQAIFRYCFSEEAYVFGLFDRNISAVEPADSYYDDVCSRETWFTKSPTTNSFNLLEPSVSDWRVQGSPDNQLTYPVSHFYMQCVDCSEETCNHPKGGSCTETGVSVCRCNEGYFGNQCQFSESEVCDVIEFDHRLDKFPDLGENFPSRFEIVRDSQDSYALFRGKAVYAYVYSAVDTWDGHISLLAFGGRRYYLIEGNRYSLFPNETAANAPFRFVKYLEENLKSGYLFDGGPNGTFPVFVSEALDLGTSKDGPTPAGLGWFYTEQDNYGAYLGVGAPISTRLRCGQCNSAIGRYCDYGGDCDDESGECICSDGYEGPLCESYVGF